VEVSNELAARLDQEIARRTACLRVPVDESRALAT
jgi:hypothetical protein